MHENKIKVFLMDEEPLAIKGWKALLMKAGGFQITSETSPKKFLSAAKPFPKFDIAIAGLGMLKFSKQKSVISALRKVATNVKIVLVVDDKAGVQKAQLAGADEAIQSPFQGNVLVYLLRGLNLDAKKLSAYYVEQLEMSSKKNYGNLIGDILEFLFAPFLTGRYIKFHLSDQNLKCSILFQNTAHHPFWDRVRLKHQGERILFGVGYGKNFRSEQISNLTNKLTGEIGRIAVVVAHSAVSQVVKEHQIALYKNEDKLVLFLSDDQIKNMLAQKAGGIDPTEILQEVYEELIAEISLL